MFPDKPANFWMKSKNIECAFQVMGDGRINRDATGPRLNMEGVHVSREANDWDRVISGIMNGGRSTRAPVIAAEKTVGLQASFSV